MHWRSAALCAGLLVWMSVALGGGGTAVLTTPKIDLTDQAALQRGMRLFANYCAGCHSLQYMRYNQVAKDVGLTDAEGNVLTEILRRSFVWGGPNATIYDRIQHAMPAVQAKQWFGVSPPDLSLEIRAKGTAWVYSFLRSFYQDTSKPWGVNNSVYVGTAMPHVLLNLQGVQQPVYTTRQVATPNGPITEKVIDHLELIQPGKMSPTQYDAAIRDIVTFLSYAAEPHRLAQRRIGFWVLAFLLVFTILAYFLKREYWRDVH